MFFHISLRGEGRKAAPAARLSDPVVVLTAMKKSEDGKALIIRLFEPTCRAPTTVLTLPFADVDAVDPETVRFRRGW